MENYMQCIEDARKYISERTGFEPEFGIILGTGLGNLANEIDRDHEINYEDIPHFPVSTVESHSGRLILGRLEGRKVIAMQGRFHYYEGYSMQQVVFPVRVMKYLGIKKLFISNAAGSLNPDYELGDLMVLNDHINMLPSNPFIGKNYPELGPRFPNPLHAYDEELIREAIEIARVRNIRCHTGVYIAVSGPALETRAEYACFRGFGGDAVGMSTVPEVLAANHMGIPCFAISVVTDQGYPPELVKPVTVEEVIAVANEAQPKMTTIMQDLIRHA